MMNKKLGLMAVGALGLVAASVLVSLRSARADGVPGSVPVQGCVRDSMGKDLEGAHSVVFRLYSGQDSPMADAFYESPKPSVEFHGCVFSELLAPDLNKFTQYGTAYLGLQIDGDEELSKRFAVGTTPFAAQARHADRATRADNGVPAGTIVAFGGGSGKDGPPGWVLCDGSVLDGSKEEYKALYAAIGEAWGDGGDGSQGTSFHVPDLQGRFLRGVDASSTVDPDADLREAIKPNGATGASVATYQNDAFGLHDHVLSDPGHSHDLSTHFVCGTGNWSYGGNNWDCQVTWQNWITASTSKTGVSMAQSGGAETRPRNAAVRYIIKL